MKKLSTPTIGEILKEEFIEPLGLSTDSVAKESGLSRLMIQEILHDQRSITDEVSTQLGRLFGVSDHYFLNLQDDIDARDTEE
ncbi:HigA family addiction module antitoxin [uncultured Limosilactobacillus sp.]|uniref:HigA family addiction module antitoxin n=1 Tax=uncultured Limosilactobacillus sp. TaxID=2837629 RepID=UPI0025F23FB0|nr:HigA family addiction module antitoxin [uncultured Limosilactobacillus sp.]